VSGASEPTTRTGSRRHSRRSTCPRRCARRVEPPESDSSRSASEGLGLTLLKGGSILASLKPSTHSSRVARFTTIASRNVPRSASEPWNEYVGRGAALEGSSGSGLLADDRGRFAAPSQGDATLADRRSIAPRGGREPVPQTRCWDSGSWIQPMTWRRRYRSKAWASCGDRASMSARKRASLRSLLSL
jgi:hypothetical protein